MLSSGPGGSGLGESVGLTGLVGEYVGLTGLVGE